MKSLLDVLSDKRPGVVILAFLVRHTNFLAGNITFRGPAYYLGINSFQDMDEEMGSRGTKPRNVTNLIFRLIYFHLILNWKNNRILNVILISLDNSLYLKLTHYGIPSQKEGANKFNDSEQIPAANDGLKKMVQVRLQSW